MNKNIVYAGQSFLDKVLELTGSIENAFEMALTNGLSITDSLVIGTSIKPSGKVKNVVVSFFSEKIGPATVLNPSYTLENENFGIGEMEIKSTFIIR
jgi:hypothetical protein